MANDNHRIFLVNEIREAIRQKKVTFHYEKNPKTAHISIHLKLNGQPLFIQAPGLVNPFLPNSYALSKGTGGKEGENTNDFKLEWNIDGYNNLETKSGQFGAMIEELEECVIQAVVDNSEEWFGRKRTRTGIVENGLFNRLIRQADPKFPARIKTALQQDKHGQFLATLFDENQQELAWDQFKPRAVCVPVLLARAVYCNQMGCGIQWSTEQVQWFTNKALPGTRPRLTKPSISNPDIDMEVTDANCEYTETA